MCISSPIQTLTAYCSQAHNFTVFQIEIPGQSGGTLYYSNLLFKCHGSMKEKNTCKGIEDHLMGKILAIISDDTCSSCVTCQSSGDIVFSHVSSILQLSTSSNSWAQ